MKFSQPVAEAILKDITDEVPYEIAAESNGVAYPTFKLWITNGKRDLLEGKTTYYSQFLSAVRDIQKNRVKKHLGNVKDAENGHKGAQWILERAYWKYFSAKTAEIELHDRVSELEDKKANKDVGETKADAGKDGEVSEASSSDEENKG
jgi:hypothetical protein